MSAAVSRENPWPDLESFRAADAEFFRGRDREGEALLQEVERARLVVLFAASGLGKTSLVHAGLSPRLAAHGYFLVPIRISYKVDAHGIDAQIFEALEKSRPPSVSMGEPRADETVWEYLHRRDPAIVGMEPFFFFDQFEELFTIGADSALAAEVKDQLRVLVEGTPPAAVRKYLDEHPRAARELTFQTHRYRVLISVRDDFLSKLETLRPLVPSIIHHRFGLLPLSGRAALEVVMQPPRAPASGTHLASAPPQPPPLVESDVAELIVRTVVSAQDIDGRPLDVLEVEPALLSVFCAELNRKGLDRQRRNGASDEPRITRDLVAGSRTEIISGFYERALSDVPSTVRTFIEEELVTELGYRVSAVLDEALITPGFTRSVLDTLVARRLLRLVEKSRALWVELTHDVLTGVVAGSRRERRLAAAQAEKVREEARLREVAGAVRKRRMWLALAGVAVVIVVLLIVLRQREALLGQTLALAQTEAQGRRRARELTLSASLRAHDYREAVAELALSVRDEPQTSWKRLLLADIVRHQGWALPLAPLFPPGPFSWVDCARTAMRCAATYRDGRVLVRGDVSLDFSGRPTGYSDAYFSRNGEGLLDIPEGAGEGIYWQIPAGRAFPFECPYKDSSEPAVNALALITASSNRITVRSVGPKSEQTGIPREWTSNISENRTISITDDAHLVAFGQNADTVALGNVQTGAKRLLPQTSCTLISTLALAPKGDLVAVACVDGSVEMRRLPEGKLVGKARAASAAISLVFREDGEAVAMDTDTGGLLLWKKPWGAFVTLSESGPSWMVFSFSPNRRRIAASSRDGSVGIWDVDSGTRVAVPIRYESLAFAKFIDDERVVVATLNGATGVWTLPPLPPDPVLDLQSQIRAAWFVSNDDIHADGARATGDRAGGKQLVERQTSPTTFSRDLQQRATFFTNSVMLGPSALAGAMSTITHQGIFSRDGARFLTVIEEKAQVWDTATHKPIGEPFDDTSDGWLSHDGEVLVRHGTMPSVTVHTLSRDGAAFAVETIEVGAVVIWVAFDATADRLAIADDRLVVRIWSRREHRFVGTPMKHHGSPTFADFSPDGKWLVTTSLDKTARVWDAETGHPVSDWLVHDDRVEAADFSPRGDRLLTAYGTKVRIWDILAGIDAGPSQAEQLARFAEILAGLRVDANTDQLVAIERPYEALQQLRTELGDSRLCPAAPTACTPGIEDYLRAIFTKP